MAATTSSGHAGPLSTRRARIVGRVAYIQANEISTPIPPGDCTVTVEHNVATLRWGAAPEESASFATAVIDEYENTGAIVYLD